MIDPAVVSRHNPDDRVSARASCCTRPDNPSEADTLMASRCAAAKDEDILVFTIALGVPTGSASYQALKECATDDKWHFSFNNSGQLDDVFEEIADEITRYLAAVRLTQ